MLQKALAEAQQDDGSKAELDQLQKELAVAQKVLEAAAVDAKAAERVGTPCGAEACIRCTATAVGAPALGAQGKGRAGHGAARRPGVQALVGAGGPAGLAQLACAAPAARVALCVCTRARRARLGAAFGASQTVSRNPIAADASPQPLAIVL